MTYPSAGEPDRPETKEPPAAPDPREQAEPAGVSEPAAPAPLSEKPVLEWTAEDWASWIEEPALVTPPPPKAEAGSEGSDPLPVPEDVRTGDDPTATWSLALDEDDEDAKWWSSVAGLPELSTEVPAPPAGAAPELTEPPPPPAPLIAPPPPPVLPPPLPLTAPAAALPVSAPPATEPRPAEPEAAPRRPQHLRPAPEAAPSRSPQSRRVPLDPADDIAVRVRAGLSLLGVSVLVGAVAAGLITVAIFMASVVLRRALG